MKEFFECIFEDFYNKHKIIRYNHDKKETECNYSRIQYVVPEYWKYDPMNINNEYIILPWYGDKFFIHVFFSANPEIDLVYVSNDKWSSRNIIELRKTNMLSEPLEKLNNENTLLKHKIKELEKELKNKNII